MPFRSDVADRWFEDYIPGDIHECGSFTVTEDEIIAFALQFDPLPFHTDPVAAQRSVFGGLVASGLHAMALLTRQLVEHYHSANATIGGIGMDNLRIIKPLRPRVRMRVRVTVMEANPSRSKPDRGFLRSLGELINEDDDITLHVEMLQLMAVRPAGGQ